MSTRIVAISDTHQSHNRIKLPDADLLIHAGDFSFDYQNKSNLSRFSSFLRWMEGQPHKHKILIAGNHDQLFEMAPERARGLVKANAPSVTYLQDSETVVEGLTIWGSPVTPSFYDWSFNRDEVEIIQHWDMIPEHIDVLVTHGPPLGYLDRNQGHDGGGRRGCRSLLMAVKRTKPLLHIFGHIHGGYGHDQISHGDGSHTDLYNVAICDQQYQPNNPATIIDLPS